MYKIIYFHDGETAGNPLYIPANEYYCLTDCQLDLTMGGAGELSFDVPNKNPAKKDIRCLADEIVVYRNDVEIFRGRAVTSQDDFDRTGTLECEGVLAYLHDSWLPPYSFSGSIRDYLKMVLAAHNKYVEPRKHIYLGNVFVKDPNDYIVRSNQDYTRCIEELTEKLTNNESLGGYLKIRYANGKRYLDYLDNYGSVAEQKIEFGYNLIDLATEIEYSNLVTAILPLGAKIETDDGEESSERITIADVNGGNIYVSDAEMVEKYGWIAECVTWDDVTQPENLLTKAKAYLQSAKYAVKTISVKAVDLAAIQPSVFSFFLGDKVHIVSTPHDVDIYADISEVTLYPLAPEQDYYTIGTEQAGEDGNGTSTTDAGFYDLKLENLFLTQNEDETEHFIDSSGETVFAKTLVFADRKYRETALEHLKKIAGEGNGLYLTKKAQSDGSEIYYLHDAEKLENSVNITRINERSVAFSTDGGANYSYGYTVDGSIAMDALEANAISGTTLKISYESLNQILASLSVDEDGIALTADNAANGNQAKIKVTGGTSGESPSVGITSTGGTVGVTAGDFSVSTDTLTISKGAVSTTATVSASGNISSKGTISATKTVKGADGSFSGTVTTNELSTSVINVSNSSDSSKHAYSKSAYIPMTTTYSLVTLDKDTGDQNKANQKLDVEFAFKDSSSSGGYLSYIRAKLPDEDWGDSTNPNLFGLTANGSLICTGITINEPGSLSLEVSSTVQGSTIHAPDSLLTTSGRTMTLTGKLNLKEGSLVLPDDEVGSGILSDVVPDAANKRNIGSAATYWKNIYVGTIYRSSESSLSTSDRKKKKDFVPIGADFDAKSFLMALKPTAYKFKDGSERTHMGFIAQDVAEAAKETVGDVAAYIAHRKDIKNDDENRAFENISDENKEWYLDYQEFIAPLVAVVQEQEKRIETLERMIADGVHE